MMSEAKVYKKEEVVTVAIFAKRLGVSRRHGYNLVEWGIAGGGVLSFRFGGKRCLRVPISEIERLRNSCQVEEG